jgi:hypothetical protein
MQRLLDGVDVPAGRGFGDVEERVVDLIGVVLWPKGSVAPGFNG